MSNLIEGSPFTLVIAEKPDAARRIASGLGSPMELKLDGITIQNVPLAFDGAHYVVAAAAGHLYGLADPQKQRRVYPVFDVEWFPLNLLPSRKKFGVRSSNRVPSNNSFFASNFSKRIRIIERLTQEAERIVHACDYDIEGETIGYNILEFAGSKSKNSIPLLRAKFSTLTGEDIRASFSDLKNYDSQMAKAGRARHVVDFVWGVNLSRAITEAQRNVSHEYRNLTIGRVQGPTLAFVVNRDIENRCHVPIPYWVLAANLRKDGIDFDARLQSGSIASKDEAERIYQKVFQEKTAKVVSLEEKNFEERPPYPFNLGDLQREAFRIYHFSPSVTLSIAEKLYLRALISYPRTTSQKLPTSIGYSSIIGRLTEFKEYSRYSDILSDENRRRYPVEGFKDDPAHPAIYPTGVKFGNSLSESEMKIYDLVARRFLSCFCKDSLRKTVNSNLAISDLIFVASGSAILREGWKDVYSWLDNGEASLPKLTVGDLAQVLSMKLDSKFTEPPRLYSPASILAKMESENIGTKATRAEVISTLIERGYIEEKHRGILIASEIGFSLFGTLDKHCPQITTTSLTRQTEELMEKIQNGGSSDELEEELIRTTMKNILQTLAQIRSSEKEIGSGLVVTSETSLNSKSSYVKRDRNKNTTENFTVGTCPSCSNGELKVIRSYKTRKRFLGCTNYKKGCRTSAPLPSRGVIQALRKTCIECKWPMISVRFSGRSSNWVLCPNLSCPSKKKTSAISKGVKSS